MRIAKLLLETTNDSFMANGSQGSLLSRLAVAALRLNNHAIATDAISYRQNQFRNDMNPLDSCAIVRNLLRAGNGTEAYQILEEELSLPMISTNEDETAEAQCNLLKSRAQALASIASWHFFGGEPRAAVYACRIMCAMGPAVRQAKISGSELGVPFLRLLQGASQCQSKIRTGEIVKESFLGPNSEKVSKLQVPCNVVYAVLDVMMTLPSENDDRVYEVLSNALVRRVLFVTGAVNMDGCPPPDRGEAAFIGRSNVGKSSLVNAVTNRKALAYTSKRPGKTQQFNFFAVNDKVGREQEIKYGDTVHGSKDADSFYMVDVSEIVVSWTSGKSARSHTCCFYQLPGFGYARVPEKQRKEWSSFMQEYIATRPTLRVLFHLIDSRHGPTEEDAAIMKQVEENIPPTAKYVIVLTKADKNSKGAPGNYSGKVSHDVMNKLRQVMGETLQHDVPVVLTSAESKLGRDKMWSYLRRAAIS